MAKYPISIQDSLHDGKMASAFWKLLKLHVPSGSKILDPTAGEKLLWAGMPDDQFELGLEPKYDIVFSDINYEDSPGTSNYQQNLGRALDDHPEWVGVFDCVVYDPPYLIGENDTDDGRESQYGSYAFSLADLQMYMSWVPSVIYKLLKPEGKLILKCSDQYVVPERKFYLHHYEWLRRMTLAFKIIDIMIYRHHRMSPTAFQVKNRPCGVVMHTYYLCGERLELD